MTASFTSPLSDVAIMHAEAARIAGRTAARAAARVRAAAAAQSAAGKRAAITAAALVRLPYRSLIAGGAATSKG